MRFFRFSLLFLFIFSCTKQNTNHSELFYFIPENTSIILKTSNIESLKSSIDNNDFLESLSQSNTYKDLNERLKNLSLLKPKGPILICFSKDNNDNLHYSAITKNYKNIFIRESLKNYQEETFTYDNKSIIKSVFNNVTFYSAIIDSTFFTSTSREIVENAFEYTNSNSDLEKIYQTTDNNKMVSIIMKNDENSLIKSILPDNVLPLKKLTTYLAIDADISQDNILINGISKANDSAQSFINVFKNTIPQENQIQNITPSSSDGFLSFTFNNFKDFRANLIKYTQVDTLKTSTTLFDNIIEAGIIYDADNNAFVLNSLDGISTEDALISEQTIIETFRQVDLFNFSRPDLFKSVFYPLISFNKATKYCVLDNFFVFADDLELLKSIISNYQNRTTISEETYFNDVLEQLSDASSLLVVSNPTL